MASKSDHPSSELDPDELVIRKRLPNKYPKRANDVYVSQRTNCKVQLERCQQLMKNGQNEIFIHGMGAAVNRAINLALQLQQSWHDKIEISCCTSTMPSVDDSEPVSQQHRNGPSRPQKDAAGIHIRLQTQRPSPGASSSSPSSL